MTQYFWPESFRITDLAVALRQRGHDVVVLTGMPNYPQGRMFDGYGMHGPWSETVEGVPVVRVPIITRGPGRGWRLALNFASFATSASVLGPPRTRGRIDIVFVYEVSPITVALPAIAYRSRRAAPVVLWVQDLWPDNLTATGAVRSPALLRSLSALTRWIYSHCDRILVESRAFLPRLEAQGVEMGKVSYLPNWAETLYHPIEVERGGRERSELPDGFVVLFAGNIGVSQDFATILSAAERLKDQGDIHWVILGDGRRRAWVGQEVLRRGLAGTVHLLGQRPVGDMPRYFALADALLLSLRRHPLYALMVPSKLQSYMACARPIVAALDGEAARIITESGGGVAVGAEDPQALADAVRALAAMLPADRLAMGARNLHYFQDHFERELVVDEVERVLRVTAEAGVHR